MPSKCILIFEGFTIKFVLQLLVTSCNQISTKGCWLSIWFDRLPASLARLLWSHWCRNYSLVRLIRIRIRIRNRLFSECTGNTLIIWSHTSMQNNDEDPITKQWRGSLRLFAHIYIYIYIHTYTHIHILTRHASYWRSYTNARSLSYTMYVTSRCWQSHNLCT